MSDNLRSACGDTFQEGTSPVQSFVSSVAKSEVGTGHTPRLGRPAKGTMQRQTEPKNQESPANNGATKESSETVLQGTKIVFGAAMGSFIAGALGAAIGAQVGAAIASQSAEVNKSTSEK